MHQASLVLRFVFGVHMSSLHNGVTSSRKSDRQDRLPPILVSVRQARELLANMSKDKFWEEVKRGALGELVGSRVKRFLFYENVKAYARALPLAPYSVKTPGNSKAVRQTELAPVVGKGGRRKSEHKAARNKTTERVGKGSGAAVST
jgi:hypothetical protein